MALAVYVHIPYCLQRCRYCDFATFEWSEILPPENYTQWVLNEIKNRHSLWPTREIQTLYFGGGTPSLIAPELILSISQELANAGFKYRPDAEITIEINPATITPQKLESYLKGGINRFSVGAQSFNDDLLKLCGRKHSAEDTRETLRLLRRNNLNYSFDLLFALPGQSTLDLSRDLDEVSEFAPPHLSAYCLTVPESHPMSLGRPPENEQIGMFALIENRLKQQGLLKYEISNFAKPGFESRHNGFYWNDQSYWGIGLSSHSYQREWGENGLRFWNPKNLREYEQQVGVRGEDFHRLLPPNQSEPLLLHESATDFAHMFLRTMKGLPEDALQKRFPQSLVQQFKLRLKNLTQQGLVEYQNAHWSLTSSGQLVSNKVFEELTFLAADLHPETLTPPSTNSYCSV